VRAHAGPQRKVGDGGFGKAQFILDKPGRIQDQYKDGESKLGEGAYGSVNKGVHRSTGAVRAIKTVAKTKTRYVERFKREIAIMKTMDHPNIIKLFETFEDHLNIYMVMEVCTGGELLSRIIEATRFNEGDAAVVMQQMLRAVFYLHEQNICHRDLKPENFLFHNGDPIEGNVLKLIDFGLSRKFNDGEPMSTKAGTPFYVAPEVLTGRYGHRVDLWSAGVIMYILLCGSPPFSGKNQKEVLASVMKGRLRFHPRAWAGISQDAKELVSSLVKAEPESRLNAGQALMHPWIRNRAPQALARMPPADLVPKLRSFQSRTKFEKAVLHVIASQLSEPQIKGLREAFLSLDQNGDGLLTLSELKAGLARTGLRKLPEDLREIMAGIDADHSGMIDYTEFLAATIERRQYIQEDVCWIAFRVFDVNGDGKITPSELRMVLSDASVNSMVNAQAIADVLKDVDKNGDGAIDFDEFMGMMRGMSMDAGDMP